MRFRGRVYGGWRDRIDLGPMIKNGQTRVPKILQYSFELHQDTARTSKISAQTLRALRQRCETLLLGTRSFPLSNGPHTLRSKNKNT